MSAATTLRLSLAQNKNMSQTWNWQCASDVLTWQKQIDCGLYRRSTAATSLSQIHNCMMLTGRWDCGLYQRSRLDCFRMEKQGAENILHNVKLHDKSNSWFHLLILTWIPLKRQSEILTSQWQTCPWHQHYPVSGPMFKHCYWVQQSFRWAVLFCKRLATCRSLT